jgi:transcriptional regulator with XRE-family HTH domain
VTACLPTRPFLTKLHLERASRRITLDELSAATFIHTADLSRIERAVRAPSEIQRKVLADALGLEADELVERP